MIPGLRRIIRTDDNVDEARFYPCNTVALRPSVIFRKVTGGFRAEWGAKVYAAAATVIATGRLHRRTALDALRAALAGQPIMQAG